MKKKKTFAVPDTIGLVHGDKRIKLNNGNGLLLWYRSDLGGPMITGLDLEEPTKCTACRLGRKHEHLINKPGRLFYLPVYDRYVISLGDRRMVGWDDFGCLFTMHLPSSYNTKKAYIVMESYNPYIGNFK